MGCLAPDLPEHQCKPHPSIYGFRGVGNLRITTGFNEANQQLLKISTHIQWQEQRREIWMDGRPHPPEYAPHTWQGFSTGRFEGGVLVVQTTHLKAGWIRRNGLTLSDEVTMTERFIRHGNYLTHIYIIEDPRYLTEPLIKTNGFVVANNVAMQPYPCEAVVEVPRPKGEVPHHLPGTNTFLEEYAKKHSLPVEAVRGGAETALPEYMKRVSGPGGRHAPWRGVAASGGNCTDAYRRQSRRRGPGQHRRRRGRVDGGRCWTPDGTRSRRAGAPGGPGGRPQRRPGTPWPTWR